MVVVGLIGNIAGALKAGQPFWTAFLLAVLCTCFLQTSMCMFFKARSDVARMTFAFYGPFAFVIGGTLFVAPPFWIIAQLQRRRV